MFVVNGRFQGRKISGVERYACEVTKRFVPARQIISPVRPLVGLSGHAWEQAVLPLRLKGRLLWSPCNTGPVAVKNHVVTIHDIIVLDRPEWYSSNFVRLYRELIPRLAAKANHVITVSQYSQDRIIASFAVSPNKISVVPNGVGSEFEPASEIQIAETRELFGIPSGPYILTVSSQDPRKNQSAVIGAWKDLTRKRIDVSLVIVGGAPEASVFKAKQEDAKDRRVIYTGYVPSAQLPVLYSGAASFVYPSLYEGFGLPILEALACGVPVVTSNNSALSELSGGKILFVNPSRVEEISCAIAEVLREFPRTSETVELCRAYARQFTWERTALMTEKILMRYC